MRATNLRTAVSIAEIVSALAVVLTLLYAVSELKRSRAVTSTDVETMLYDRMLEMDRLAVEADGFADILVRAQNDAADLSPTERVRYLAYEHIFFDAWEAAVEAAKHDLIGAASFDSWNDFFIADASRKPKWAWAENRRFYGSEFIRYVDERVTW